MQHIIENISVVFFKIAKNCEDVLKETVLFLRDVSSFRNSIDSTCLMEKRKSSFFEPYENLSVCDMMLASYEASNDYILRNSFLNDHSRLYQTFHADPDEWIDFVCACRDGGNEYTKYDIISGKVANDKVFRVVDMYHQGIWDKERALKEIKVYDVYDQIAFISQKAIDQLLSFKSYYEV